MDFWPFVRQQPREVTKLACEIVENGLDEVKKLERLKENGSSEEKDWAAKQLAEMGVPAVWFRERFGRRYPSYTYEEMGLLLAFACRAIL
jgi:hypothetical protein